MRRAAAGLVASTASIRGMFEEKVDYGRKMALL